MVVQDRKYELEFDRVSDFLEDVAVRVSHVKNLLEVLANEDKENLQLECMTDLLSIAHDYTYEVENMLNDTIKKIDISLEFIERKNE